MAKSILYTAVSHPGRLRKQNQDNLLCVSHYLPCIHQGTPAPIRGLADTSDSPLFAVFDGMGGEEMGETAAYLAASTAARLRAGPMPVPALYNYCLYVNDLICTHTNRLGITSMGTTAAMAVFLEKGVCLCSIGDSRIYRFRDGILTQLTEDHVLPCKSGRKPPLLQNLGIPESEMRLEPSFYWDADRTDDIYLICTDGLTDMIPDAEICRILAENPFEGCPDVLLTRALANGGKDNITLILCKITDDPQNSRE